MKNKSDFQGKLQQLGLTGEEAAIFMCLIDAPKTLLEVSRVTGIHRSSVYRIVDGLLEKSILREITTQNGRLFATADPEALELLVFEQERLAEARRNSFMDLAPLLKSLKNRDEAFALRTYSGVAGVKQMLWNELKSKSELLVFTAGPLEQVLGKRWAEKYRAETVRRGILQRNIENPGIYTPPLSLVRGYDKHYIARRIPKEVLAIHHELTVHDDTISIYNSWTDNVQLGAEVKNPFLANFMRQIFEHYWSLAS